MLQKLNKNRGGFTLVEIMIVVAIIALLAVIAVPGFLRARKRSQATRILNDLRLIDAAVDQYAIEANLTAGQAVTWDQIKLYLKPNSTLYSTGVNVLVSWLIPPTATRFIAASVWTRRRSRRLTGRRTRTLGGRDQQRVSVAACRARRKPSGGHCRRNRAQSQLVVQRLL